MDTIIEVQELMKSYGSVRAVQGISFRVQEGAFFSFLGVNGAGKSTTINILCTVLQKTAGSVKIGGYDLDTQPEKIKELIGIVFQGSVMDRQLTVRENLRSRAAYYGMSGREAKERIAQLSDLFELEALLNRRYERLSGGQQRRVDIARALLHRPRLLFLDEPTTGLDPQTRRQVWSVVHRLRRESGLTVFLTTHYMEETADCDQVVILDSGRIVAADTPHNLKKQYAGNRLVWYVPQAEGAFLREEGLPVSYQHDAYHIEIETTQQATALLKRYPQILDYEVVKGNMDDVFLKVTGKRLGE